MALVAALPSCQVPVQGGRTSFLQQQPFCTPAALGAPKELPAAAAAASKGWSGKSCSCGSQQLDCRKSNVVPMQKEELSFSQMEVAMQRAVA